MDRKLIPARRNLLAEHPAMSLFTPYNPLIALPLLIRLPNFRIYKCGLHLSGNVHGAGQSAPVSAQVSVQQRDRFQRALSKVNPWLF